MTLVLAHRGARRQAPENTIEAFRVARAEGADGVELDVHRASDGVLIVHHDPIAPALGVLAELDSATIRATVPAIPTLEAALDELAGLLVNVELKNLPPDPDYDPSHRAADDLLELLSARGSTDRVLVSSFNIDTVDRVRALDATIPTGYLTFGMEPAAAIAIAMEHGHQAWHPDRATMTEGALDIAAAAHGAGLEVNVWTVNDAAELAAFASSGVDGLITDVPDVAVSALAARPT